MKKIKSNSDFIAALEKKFKTGENNIHVFDREGVDGQVVISAEHGDMIDNFPVADYYEAAYMDPDEECHRFGINRKLLTFCKSVGWGLDWENAGCLSAYRDF